MIQLGSRKYIPGGSAFPFPPFFAAFLALTHCSVRSELRLFTIHHKGHSTHPHAPPSHYAGPASDSPCTSRCQPSSSVVTSRTPSCRAQRASVSVAATRHLQAKRGPMAAEIVSGCPMRRVTSGLAMSSLSALASSWSLHESSGKALMD